MFVLELTFWSIVALGLITYLLYPAMVGALGALVARGAAHRLDQSGFVSILIAAYNEEKYIHQKLISVLNTNYMGDFEILVADDGSSDETASLVEKISVKHPDKVRLFRLPRGGKAAGLNTIAAAAKGDVLVFTDADPIWTPDTLPNMINAFGDPRTGAVAGVVETEKQGRKHEETESFYRVYENWIRRGEGVLFGCISADGGLYAVRRHLFKPVPAGVTDDFFVSTSVVLQGARIAFAQDAKVFERSIEDEKKHFRRRVRITVRGLTSLWHQRKLLNPLRFGFYAVGLFFHKVLRRLVPALSFLLLPLSMLLWTKSVGYQLVALGLVGGVSVALLPIILPAKWPKPVLALHLALNHFAGIASGFVLFCLGVRYTQWTPQKTETPENAVRSP